MFNEGNGDWIFTEKLSKLNYLKPEYLNGKGDVTRCVFQPEGTDQEEFHDPRPIKRLVDDLLLMFGKSRRSLKLSQQQHLDRERNQPLVLHNHLALIPVKLRTKRIARDTSTGYLVLSQISTVLPDPQVTASAWILFKDGSSLQTFHSVRTVRQNMRNGYYAVQQHQIREKRGMHESFPTGFFSA